MNGELRALIEFAKSLGWSVERTNNRHVKFTMAGAQTVFTSGTPSDSRSWKNCRARLKRFANQPQRMAA